MHLGNSVICPVTGIPMILAAGAVGYLSFKKLKGNFKKSDIMGVISLSAFVFALQMINVSSGMSPSSAHIIGGALLAIVLGQYLGFLSMGAILLIQSLFFADGGLLAYGLNAFNMGMIACFAAYPLIYKPLCGKNKFAASFLTAFAAVMLGAFGVCAEGFISGSITDFGKFCSLMIGAHLLIAAIEGVFTGAVVCLKDKVSEKASNISLLVSSFLLAGVISNYASNKPDGLEWSLLNMSDSFIAQTQGWFYAFFSEIQTKTSALFGSMEANAANLAGLIVLAAVLGIFLGFISKSQKTV